jgi:chemotaxis signal transduction protein
VGLELAHVVEVVQIAGVHPVPSQERSVRGVVQIHGRILPVVHLSALLEGGACPSEPGDLVVVVMLEGRRLCLEIDDAEVVVRQPAMPVPPGSALPWAIGVARYSDELVPLLDLTALSSRFIEVSPI